MATIRLAHPGDAAALADLAERTFREAFTVDNDPGDMELHCTESFSPEIQQQEIEDPDCVTIVAEVENELVAFAQVRLQAPKECVSAEHPSELYRFYVSSPWHGRGIAQEMMREVRAAAARSKSDCIWLGVWEHNPRALAFYRKHGFRIVGDHVFRLGDTSQRDLIMAVGVNELSVA